MTTTDIGHDPATRRQRAVDYHLGRLSEDQVATLEAEYFSDQSAFDAVDHVADELVDDYLNGHLDDAARARVEWLAGSPEWHDRLRFARALREHARDGLYVEASPTLWARLTSLFEPTSWQLGMGAVAVAAVMLAVGTSLWTQRELRVARDLVARVDADREAAVATARSAEARATEQQAAREAVARQLESVLSLAVMLIPGTRSDSGAVVRIPEHASLVRFTLVQDDPLPSGIVGARYVLDRGGVQVAGGEVPPSAISAAEGSLVVAVPTAALAAGQHEMRISLATTPGRFTDFASYVFAVVR